MKMDLNDINGKDSEGIGFWIIEKAISIVDREAFLTEILGNKLSSEQLQDVLEKGTCFSNISVDIVNEAADICINNIKKISNGESALTGLPGGVAGITAGILLDIIQLYTNLINLIQKLIYLYGIDFIFKNENEDEDEDEDEDIKNNKEDLSAIILCFIAIALEARGVDDIIKVISKGMEMAYIKQSKKFILLAKPTFYSMAKKIAKKIGLSITKKGFARAASKAVPIVSCAISLLLNNFTFAPMTKRLKNELEQIYKNQQSSDIQNNVILI